MQQVSASPQLSTGNSHQVSAPVQGNPRHRPRGLPLPQSTFDSSSSSHQSMAQIANSSSSTSQEMSATNTPSHTYTSGRDQELNTLHERLQLDIKNYKDTIATQSRVAFECAKKELSTHYQQQMNQQEINHSQSVNALKQQINDVAIQLYQQQAATQEFNHTQPHPTMPLDTSFPPPPQTINQSQYHSIYQNTLGMNESLLQGLGMMHKSITTQCLVLQDQMRQSQSASKEQYLSNAKPCDGKDPKEFGTWLDDVSRIATISGKDQAEVVMAISRGPLHKYINDLYSSGLIWASIKPKLQERFSECGSSTIVKHKLTT